ncbi:MAG: hypothetical protein U0791_25750 [Gemmataceae bacterium]
MSETFEVSQSHSTIAHLKKLLELLRDQGKSRVTAKALRWIHDELTRTPMQFGESRYHLAHLDLHVRVAFVATLAVEFAVNETSRQVFIRRWGLQKD